MEITRFMYLLSRLDKLNYQGRKLSINFTLNRDTVDPLIEITCLDKKKFTSSKNDIGPTGVVHWGEHIFFEPKKLVRYITYKIPIRI